jgi:competence CoiA-like predicted nuclease
MIWNDEESNLYYEHCNVLSYIFETTYIEKLKCLISSFVIKMVLVLENMINERSQP